MARFGYSPTEADQAKGRIEDHLRPIKHHLERLRLVVPGSGQIAIQVDEINGQVEKVGDQLCDLVDERTEVAPAARPETSPNAPTPIAKGGRW